VRKRTPKTNGHARRVANGNKQRPLTDVDREGALELVRGRCASLVADCWRMTIDQAEQALAGNLHGNRVGFPFAVDEPGEPKVSTCDDGLVVERDGRRGVITWADVAGELVGDEDDSIDGEADLRDDEPNTAVDDPAPAGYVDQVVPLEAIVVSKHNPRQTFDEAKLAELAASIERHGLLEPLLVRPLDASSSGLKPQASGLRYELVAGERRLRASKLAGKTDAPVRIAPLSESEGNYTHDA